MTFRDITVRSMKNTMICTKRWPDVKNRSYLFISLSSIAWRMRNFEILKSVKVNDA